MSIRIIAVLGSVRPGNFTSKALALVVDELKKHKDVDVDLVDPASMKLPLPGRGMDRARRRSSRRKCRWPRASF